VADVRGPDVLLIIEIADTTLRLDPAGWYGEPRVIHPETAIAAEFAPGLRLRLADFSQLIGLAPCGGGGTPSPPALRRARTPLYRPKLFSGPSMRPEFLARRAAMAGGHHSGGHHSGGHHSGDYHHGEMDIAEHKSVFGGFMKVTEWGAVLIAASVAMFTFAFAIGLGWWTGLIVYAVICVLAGLIMKMGGAWWVTTAITVVLLGVGGAITMGLLALAG
jgi:hypothetical protein